MNEEGSVEDKKDFKGKQGVYKRWTEERDLSIESEKDWLNEADIAVQVYRSEKVVGSKGRDGSENFSGKRKYAFNILWANVETKRPALYNSLPRPDIRRRHKDKDKLGRAISELLERCTTYVIDEEDMDLTNKAAVNDMLTPGRAVTRIKYIPTMIPGEPDEEGKSEDVVGDQQIRFDQVQYDAFHRGPGKSWDEVQWLCFDHRFTKEMVDKKWGDEIAGKLQYGIVPKNVGKDDEDLDDTDDSLFKRVMIYEFWDKVEKEVIWLAEGHKDGPLSTDEDPLNLKGFFDIPRPLYAIESSTSLVPIAEYSQYRVLADELEDITVRIGKIIKAIRARGVYDSSIVELEKLFSADDNEFIPAEGLSRLIETGGLDKAIWMLPVEKLAQTLQILKEQRVEIIQEIYQITGISDIQRGSSNPHETAQAQRIKANFGGQRLKRQQEDVERYFRDQIRIVVEIIAENFSRETLTMMSGLSFPTNQDKQIAQQILQRAQQFQQQAQQAQQQGLPAPQPVDPRRVKRAQQIASKPSWEEIEEAMSNDLKRAYRIDIETDSTIKIDQEEDNRQKSEALTAIGQFLGWAEKAMETGIIDREGAKEILLAQIRSMKMGRSVEDAIENMKPPQPKPDPDQMKMQAQMKMDQQSHQMDMQGKQVDLKISQLQAQSESQKIQQEMQVNQQEGQLAQAEHAQKMEALRLQNEFQAAQHKRKMKELNETNIQARS